VTVTRSIRILIVDDHPIFRDGLRRLLEAEPDLKVVGEAVNAEEAVRLTRTLTPDLVLLDVAMPKVSGLEALVSLTESPKPPVVMLLTAGIDKAEIVKALQLGARGVVLKQSATSLLFKAIRIVMDGGYWVGRDSVSDLLLALRTVGGPQERVENLPAFQLTQRELQVIGLVVAAAGNKKIAETLAISEKTVKHHLTNIFEKLNVTSRLELALFAAHNNLIPKE
jgi:two-component system nitrate/nitrite response regulator NarL